MAGNQSYVCTWYVGEGMIQIWLCQMADNQAYEKGIVQTWKINRMCVHSIWRRVWSKSKPDCVKLLEMNPMCVHGM